MMYTTTILGWLGLALVAYILTIAFYRLFLSPIAKFPGPKTTALSYLDEAYYAVLLKGQHYRRLDTLHDQYGPIVRITPREIHIRDSDFWEEVFDRRPKADKDPTLKDRYGGMTSTFTCVDAAWHRRLRAPINPFFSRRSILAQEQMIQDKVELLCSGIERAFLNDAVVSTTAAFSALTADVISHYAYGFAYGQLESEGWEANLEAVYRALNAFGNVLVQVPLLNSILLSLPDAWIAKMDPDFGRMLRLRAGLTKRIAEVRQAIDTGDSKEASRTMFGALLTSDLPESDKTDTRVGDESHSVVGAGIMTTSFALTVAVYHILANPDILSKLNTELLQAIPNSSMSDAFSYTKLEKLPYLRGCIKEGIRHSYGASGRLGRVFHEPLQYKGWEIPPGTIVSMSTRHVIFDPDVYEEANQFQPERWMPERSKTKGGANLESYFIPFSSGPRACLGINLAYMEMYVTLSHVFRRFSLELYETDVSDVAMVEDNFIPAPKPETKGVRVKVLKVVD